MFPDEVQMYQQNRFKHNSKAQKRFKTITGCRINVFSYSASDYSSVGAACLFRSVTISELQKINISLLGQ